jgi:hypothetical protein
MLIILSVCPARDQEMMVLLKPIKATLEEKLLALFLF